MIIARQAIYGLNSSDTVFWAFLAGKLDDKGFKRSISDPDVWVKSATKTTGEKYYEYILCHIYDLLCISHDTRKPMNDIQSKLKVKNDKLEEPDFYLGEKLFKKELNEKQVWTMSSTEYIK